MAHFRANRCHTPDYLEEPRDAVIEGEVKVIPAL